MAIIVSRNGKNAKKIDRSSFAKERNLQQYIYENPESIPLYDYKDDIRLLILAREFPTESGSIDAIGIDEEGEIYLVETKLFKNPDKRLVVAQVLDYGASLWRSYGEDDFIRGIEHEVNKTFKVSLDQKLSEFYDLEDEEVSELVENLKGNLHDGNFRFVVLMDQLHSKLKNLILFINENSRFDIFAVEMEYYKHEDYEILIPKLFGSEVKKEKVSPRGRWDEKDFFDAAKKKIEGGATFNTLKSIYEFTVENGKLDWGTGGESGSFTFKFDHPSSKHGRVSLFTVWTKGSIRFRFANMAKRLGKDAAENYFRKLSILPIWKGWNNEVIERYGPAASLHEAFPDERTIKSFKSAILDFLKEIGSKKIEQ